MASHPPDYYLIHPLPPAPHFVGRDAELQELRALSESSFRGVVALVGLGGAGKTAVAARFLDGLLAPDYKPRPEGLFVWSFYQEPDAGLFLQEVHRYFAGGGSTPVSAKGAGLLHLLRDALSAGGPHLLVLDGLERVQRPESTGPDAFGQIEDPLLRGLLTRIAEGVGQVTALVTSRFPLSDLHSFLGHGYRYVEIGGLDLLAARALLRSRGVQGDDSALDKLIERFGAHALTLDHLGGLIGQFLGGDPSRAPEVSEVPVAGGDRQALRLARLLRAYEEHLPADELTLLSRLSLLRRSVSEEKLMQLFLCEPAVHARTIRELADLVSRLPTASQGSEAKRRDLAESIRLLLEEALCAAPIAGPEEIFRQEISKAAEELFAAHEKYNITSDLADLVRPYANALHDPPTDVLPLSTWDRELLCKLYERYDELRDNCLLQWQHPPQPLEHAFQILGYVKPKRSPPTDLGAADVLTAFRRVQKQLLHLIGKHFALQRVREVCRIYQRKWSLAGPLAHRDSADLRRVLESLVARHLVLREPSGTYSVHPAVRDHFARLAASERGNWHDVLREQMISLLHRPGRSLPEDAATLDLAEEAIYHTLQAGRFDTAVWIYQELIGGLRHLGWKLGEMARGLRILREFNPCPDRWALAWYLRALGEFEEAYQHNGLPSFRADIRLLQGRLPQVAAQGDDRRTAVAAFLMGRGALSASVDPLGCAIPREQLFLYLGRLPREECTAQLEDFYRDIGWEGDRTRSLMMRAEIARRQGDAPRCRQYLDAASRWILHSGSVEHLCLLHLIRARTARSAGELEPARRAVLEGLHVARQCGLGLYHIDLLCEQAEICLVHQDARAAEDSAREAQQRASGPDCQFLWGAAEAAVLVGRSLLLQKRTEAARAVLEETLALQSRLNDPKSWQTEQLLQGLSR